MMLVHTSRTLRILLIAGYLLMAAAAMSWHVHDGDEFAGYDEHCISCHWTTYAPVALGVPCQPFCLATPAMVIPLSKANPSKHAAFTKRHGRSPPAALSAQIPVPCVFLT
jgi:hypothetical protein